MPKTLPAGIWTKAIQNYESQQIGGCDRTFPTNELLGAESVLARIHHEVTVSKLFTPVQLGEILQKRTFQASGEPNVLAKKESKSTTFTVSNDQLVASEEQVWQPRSLLAILDGLSSIRWAYILLQVGPEKSVHSFFDWAIKLARSRPQKPDQLNQWWVTVSWKLALELRGGKTWESNLPRPGASRTPSPTPKERVSTSDHALNLMANQARAGTSRSTTTQNPSGRRTTTPRAAGSRTSVLHGTMTSGTRVGPVPRNRDSTGSLSGLQGGHPAALL